METTLVKFVFQITTLLLVSEAVKVYSQPVLELVHFFYTGPPFTVAALLNVLVSREIRCSLIERHYDADVLLVL